MALFRIAALPDEPLAAAARFHARFLPDVLAELNGATSNLTLVFAPADHRHRGWRLAVIQGLAREHAPIRVNAVASNDERAIAAAAGYLDTAEGVTGQLLVLDDTGAGEMLFSGA